MSEMKLRVEVNLTPHPEKIDSKKLDELIDGELSGFQNWIMEKNRAAGIGASPLSAPERLAVKSYLIYISTRPA